MTVGTQVNAISVQLNELLSRIHQETLSRLVKATSVNPADPDTAAYYNKLEGWKARLNGLREQLTRLEQQVDAQRAFAPPVPRGATGEMRRTAAYRATQSLNTKSADIAAALALAAHVSAALVDLLARSITPTKLDIEKGATDLLEEPIKFAEKLESLSSTIRKAEHAGQLDHHVAGELRTTIAQLRAAGNMGPVPAPAPDYLGVATFMLTLVRIWWLERLRQSMERSKARDV
jgi:hypothetical protein